MKDLKKIYENLRLTTDEIENKQAVEMVKMIKEDHGNDSMMLGMSMYAYGKMVGKRKERAKKNRADLLKKYPEMRDLIKKASVEVIYILKEMQKLTQEERDAYEDYLNFLSKERAHLTEVR